MKNWFQILLFIMFVSCPNGLYIREGPTILELFLQPYRNFRNTLFNYLNHKMSNERNQRALQRIHVQWQPILNESARFPCSLKNSRSAERPNSVHRLKPGDIDIVGVIGDSLSAGFALRATSIEQIFYESRDISFTGGGFGTWREYLTLPNILKVFNPKLIGYSTKASISTQRESQFNVAEGGAISQNMPYMAKVLVKRIKNDPRVSVKKDWKLVSYLIGANDFCSEICFQSNPEDIIEKHRLDLLDTLRYLRDNLPRTMVILIPPPDTNKMAEFKNTPLICSLFTHSIACPCAVGLAYKNKRRKFKEIVKRWQQTDFDVANYEEFNNNDEFAVVVQPLFVNVTFPVLPNGSTDFSVLSEDCFHFSQKGGARVANSLWNNLIQPVGKKEADIVDETFARFLCPSNEHPYIFTNKNSN